jgi:HSP20 family molecular chaperone IbpA
MRGFAPRFDVRESKDGYHLDGELPGLTQNQVDIEFSDPQTLVIKGHVEREYQSSSDPDEKREPSADVSKAPSGKQVSKESHKHRFWVSERSVGDFHRSFNFPTRVDQENVKASLKNGVLSVTVPKSTAPATKKISIE